MAYDRIRHPTLIRRVSMIGLREIKVEADDTYSVELELIGRSGRSRRAVARIQGRRVLDLQADDGRQVWLHTIGDPKLDKLVTDRALEEVARLRAVRQALR